MKRLLAGILLLSATPVMADDPFDRVFTTPEQRRALDAYRESGANVPEPEQATNDSADIPETEKVRFSGYLLRSDGRQTFWVDGQSEVAGESSGKAGASHGRVRRGEEAVQFRARRESRDLKPGQVWLLNEDKVIEGYQLADEAGATEESQGVDDES